MATKSDDSTVATVSAVSNKQFTVTLTKDGSTNVELSSGDTVVTIPVTVTTPEPTEQPEIETDVSSVEVTPDGEATINVTKIVPALTGDQTLTVFDQAPNAGITVSYDKSVGDYGMIIIDADASVAGDGSVTGAIGITHPLSPAGIPDQLISYSVVTPVEQDIEVWPTNIMQNAVVKLTPGSATTLAVTKLSPALTSGQKLGVKLKNSNFEDDTVNSKYITAEYDPSVGQLGSVIVHASSDLPTDGSVSGSIDVTLPGSDYPDSNVHYEAVAESSMPKITDLQIASPVTGTANTDIVIKPTSITPSDAKMTSDEVELGFSSLSNNASLSSLFDNDGNLVINVSTASTGTIPLIYSLGKDFKVINLELDIK